MEVATRAVNVHLELTISATGWCVFMPQWSFAAFAATAAVSATATVSAA